MSKILYTFSSLKCSDRCSWALFFFLSSHAPVQTLSVIYFIVETIGEGAAGVRMHCPWMCTPWLVKEPTMSCIILTQRQHEHSLILYIGQFIQSVSMSLNWLSIAFRAVYFLNPQTNQGSYFALVSFILEHLLSLSLIFSHFWWFAIAQGKCFAKWPWTCFCQIVSC